MRWLRGRATNQQCRTHPFCGAVHSVFCCAAVTRSRRCRVGDDLSRFLVFHLFARAQPVLSISTVFASCFCYHEAMIQTRKTACTTPT